MVSFELGKEIEKDVFFCLFTSMGQRKNSESPLGIERHRERASERGIRRSEVRFLMGTQNFFLCPTLVTRRKKTSFTLPQDSFVLTTELIM